MQSLADALAGLQHLKELLDRYNPIKYQSGDEVRALAQEIPQAYGAVEEVYKHYTGSQRVELIDGKRLEWHLAHAKACGCRDLSAAMLKELRRRATVTAPTRRPKLRRPGADGRSKGGAPARRLVPLRSPPRAKTDTL